MTHREKVDQFVAEAAQAKISKYTAAPPLFRLLWRAEVEIPPPAFMGFWTLFLIMGGYWGAIMFIFFWFMFRVWWAIPTGDLLSPVVVAACAFGLIMAVYFRHEAKRMHLPNWSDYGTSH